ncbi:unnamed protein product [Pleuronectes platessa]|uniref:Uncharacterized protein n=1 Tax=Pleuronectes platessa TaxID=8262 RepID=A0A9N7U9V9_PLEPL|nr:unnamed protein product [Pleuronectes platessa]
MDSQSHEDEDILFDCCCRLQHVTLDRQVLLSQQNHTCGKSNTPSMMPVSSSASWQDHFFCSDWTLVCCSAPGSEPPPVTRYQTEPIRKKVRPKRVEGDKITVWSLLGFYGTLTSLQAEALSEGSSYSDKSFTCFPDLKRKKRDTPSPGIQTLLVYQGQGRRVAEFKTSHSRGAASSSGSRWLQVTRLGLLAADTAHRRSKWNPGARHLITAAFCSGNVCLDGDDNAVMLTSHREEATWRSEVRS